MKRYGPMTTGMTKKDASRRSHSKSGASLMIAMILMLAFLTVGTAVLTAARVSLNSADGARNQAKLYYFARSAAHAVTVGLTEDRAVAARWTRMAASGKAAFTVAVDAPDLPGETQGGAALEARVGSPVIENGALLRVEKMTVRFAVERDGRQYSLFADYSYERPENGGTGWRLEKYYQ